MREEAIPISLARDQAAGLTALLALEAKRANIARSQRDRHGASALRLACENLTLRGCCARKGCKAYCERARRMAGDDYSERGDAFLD